jgi:hypothetical protein
MAIMDLFFPPKPVTRPAPPSPPVAKPVPATTERKARP